MLARVDAGELAEWEALYRIEPWGEARADWCAAMVAWMVYQANRGKDSPDRPLTDFMPRFDDDDEPARPSPDELRQKMLGYTAATGGAIRHG